MKIAKSILCIISLATVIFIAVATSAAERQLQDGHYDINIKLMHAEKDRESMGSKGLSDKAELVVDNGKAFLYMEAVPIKEESLTSSVIDCYLLEGNAYKKLAAGDWSLELPDVKGNRPTIFEVPIDKKVEYLKVLVNPQVIFMGSVPLPARLKIDWNSLKKTDKSTLYERFKNGDKPMDKHELWMSAAGLSVMPEQNDFENIPELTVTNILPGEVNKMKSEVGADKGQAWEILLTESIDEIPEDKVNHISELRKVLSRTKMTVLLPKSVDGGSAILYVFSADGERSKAELKPEGKFWKAEHVPSGKILLSEAASSERNSSGMGILNDKNAASTEITASEDITETSNADILSDMPMMSGLPDNLTGISENTVSDIVGVNKGRTDLSNNANSNNADEIKRTPSEKEHKGIILTVIAIFIIMITSGFAVWRRQLPNLINEIERYRYLQYFERKVMK